MTSNRKLGLDLIRMCAILPVLVVHFSAIAYRNTPDIIYVGGDLGVEIFFALSGFLIGGIIIRDFQAGFSLRAAWVFYVRRWMRTLPMYYLFLASNLLFTAYGFMADPAISKKCALYLVFLQNLHWPMVADWYQESWSLAVEEWFYLLFPALFVALVGIPARLRVLGVALILIVGPLTLRYIAAHHGHSVSDIWRTVAYRLDAIAFGILAVWITVSFPSWSRYWRNVIGIAGAVGVTLSIMAALGAIATTESYRAIYSFTVVSISFAAIVLWASQKDWSAWRESGEARVIEWISTRSYALYLCHGAVIRAMVHQGAFTLPHAQSTSIYLVSVFALSELLHRVVERPFMRLRPAEIHTKNESVDPKGRQKAARGYATPAENSLTGQIDRRS
ncbi:acyltransferase family protein [Burkholderia gladioli]|uniref:acyltransferase family protein n=1 Tax=Burkholderia gladioli TaxID=28095 RepID=UPI0016405CE3|nr:acyltransferase [Burkholderia gladioli]